MITLKEVGQIAQAVADAANGAEEVVSIVVRSADGIARHITAAELEHVRETEAGRSISRASHLAGLREALMRVLYVDYIPTNAAAQQAADAIMVEIARRMP